MGLGIVGSVGDFDEFQEDAAAVPRVQKRHRAVTRAGANAGWNGVDSGSCQSSERLIQIGYTQADMVQALASPFEEAGDG